MTMAFWFFRAVMETLLEAFSVSAAQAIGSSSENSSNHAWHRGMDYSLSGVGRDVDFLSKNVSKVLVR